jgi:hypothetical protein
MMPSQALRIQAQAAQRCIPLMHSNQRTTSLHLKPDDKPRAKLCVAPNWGAPCPPPPPQPLNIGSDSAALHTLVQEEGYLKAALSAQVLNNHRLSCTGHR